MLGQQFYHETMRNVIVAFGTLFNKVSIIFVNSDGTVYPTVSGIFIVLAPHFIASSTVLHI